MTPRSKQIERALVPAFFSGSQERTILMRSTKRGTHVPEEGIWIIEEVEALIHILESDRRDQVHF
ncbi:hypothetical protein GCM10007416_15340 [Kroppenstedtia guangzhouensis]|uniref:Uncharacterized protein n=1 Tax=Kroppenstedtia guangzhouensis TaxID=1274356 RepID=A0ABQ1GG99_9BACL|nr:hypothetical protein GCM10007416_15340 [Kroppenstedtia guangzhouensis]